MPKQTRTSDPLSSLKEKIDQFSQEREWGQFHTPKNLAMALTVEAAELMEIFQWLSGEAETAGMSKKKRVAIEHEVADIFIYLLRFCSVAGIDLLAATETKLKKNAEKYPAHIVKGKSKKYTEY